VAAAILLTVAAVWLPAAPRRGRRRCRRRRRGGVGGGADGWEPDNECLLGTEGFPPASQLHVLPRTCSDPCGQGMHGRSSVPLPPGTAVACLTPVAGKIVSIFLLRWPVPELPLLLLSDGAK
jgi:hypothetical protein